MKRLIDIVKQQSFNAPLVQTLDDLKILTNAVKDLSDKVEMLVRKSLTVDTKKLNKKTSKKKAKKKSKAIKHFPLIKPNNKQQQTQQTTTPSTATKSLPTNNNVNASSFSAKNISDLQNDFVQKQKALQPIKPTPSF